MRSTIRLTFTFSLLLLWGCGLIAQTFHPDYLDGYIYLKVKDSSSVVLDPYNNSIPALNTILTTFGVDSLYKAFRTQDPTVEKIYRAEFSSISGTGQLISQLQALSFIDYAEKVPLFRTTGTAFTPNDLDVLQWHLDKIDAPLAWDVTQGSPQVKLAIVDNAVRTGHEDLAGVLWVNPGETPGNFLDDDLNGYPDDVNGYDVADMDNDPNPPAGIDANSGWNHGTHAAGIACAATDNGVGIASIGFNLRLVSVKASSNATGPNTLERAYEGIDYAVSAGADIVSMSWGSSGNSVTGNTIVSLAETRGVVLIGAAGNNNDSTEFFPGAYNTVLCVGSTDDMDLKSSFSNYGPWLDVVAPGSGIYSTIASATNAYGTMSGTSMACPLAAGLAGLVLSTNGALTTQQVRDAIIDGCVDIDSLNPSYAEKLGNGRINAHNTLLLLNVGRSAAAETAGLSLFPNPAHDRVLLLLSGEVAADGRAEVFAADGRRKLLAPVRGARTELDLDGLPCGVYLVVVTREGQRFVSRLVKQ